MFFITVQEKKEEEKEECVAVVQHNIFSYTTRTNKKSQWKTIRNATKLMSHSNNNKKHAKKRNKFKVSCMQ